MLTLLPPNSPFFKLQVDDFTLAELAELDARAEVEEAFSKIERAVMDEIASKAFRVSAFQAFRLLITTGNALIFISDKGKMKVFRLDQYVIRRDSLGEVLEILIREEVHPLSLPNDVREHIKEHLPDYDLVASLDKDKDIELFTRVVRDPDSNKWEVSQECLDMDIPSSRGSYPLDSSPWFALRWSSLVGEDYGRGLIEEHLGDLLALEGLTQSILEGAVIASRTIGLVDPTGVTRTKKLVEARNGDFIDGRADDVSFLKTDKVHDLRTPLDLIFHIEKRLSHSFLLMESIQRDAERVTAEEIRLMARELEGALGGIYSILSQEFQLPLVKRVMAYMTKAKTLPSLPDNTAEPAIVTGLEALGRGHDLDKLGIFMDMIEPFGDEGKQYVNISDYLTRVGTGLGLSTEGLVKSEEQVTEEMEQAQQQAQLQEIMSGAMPELTKGLVQQGQGGLEE